MGGDKLIQNSQSCQTELIDPIAQSIRRVWPAKNWIDSSIVIALSGGPDSVALFRILLHMKQQLGTVGATDLITIVHVNHKTRSQNEQDAKFVNELGARFGIDVRVVDRTNDRSVKNNNVTSEESLRDFRYQVFVDVAHQIGARYVVTGHNTDDQIETILFRLLRGTSLAGLQGIPRIRVDSGVSIVRPLLNTRRTEILQLLRDLDQPYCVDDSNLESAYTRNFLRNEIIPKLSSRFDGQFENAILRIAEQTAEHISFLDQLTDVFVESFRVSANGEPCFDVSDLRKQHPVLVRHAIKRFWREARLPEQSMTQEKWQALSDIVKNPGGGRIQLPGHITAKMIESSLVLSRT